MQNLQISPDIPAIALTNTIHQPLLSPSNPPLFTTPLPEKTHSTTLDSATQFVLPQQKIGALFGFSGSGKNALLAAIAGISRTTVGEIKIFGTDITALSADALRKFRRNYISVVLKYTNLVADLSVKQNILLPFTLSGSKVAPEKLQEITRLFGVHEILHRYPAEISHLAARKAALARAVFSGKPLLLAFEPNSKISQLAQREILSLLQLACHEYGITVLYSTDYPQATSIAHSAYLMRDGQLIGEIANPNSRTILFAFETLDA